MAYHFSKPSSLLPFITEFLVISLGLLFLKCFLSFSLFRKFFSSEHQINKVFIFRLKYTSDIALVESDPFINPVIVLIILY
jgi:hypothetical protein